MSRLVSVVVDVGTATGPSTDFEYASVGPIPPALPAAPVAPAVPGVPAAPGAPGRPRSPRRAWFRATSIARREWLITTDESTLFTGRSDRTAAKLVPPSATEIAMPAT